MGYDEFDGVGGGNFALKIFEQRFTIGQGNSGDSLSAGALEVLSVLDVVILDVIHKGFERIKITLFGSVGGFSGAREGVVGTKSELVADSDDLVELSTDGEVAEGGEGVHDGAVVVETENAVV